MSVVADCTVPEKILLAAANLEEQGQSPFSAEALIVASWQKFPKTFGLKGFTDQHPDSNKVLSSIMGEKGLARRGWLIKVGQKLYTLSQSGRQVVRTLLEGGETPALTSVRHTSAKVSRDHEKFLQTLFSSSALEKFNEGRRQEITFGDACKFWNIAESMSGEMLDSRLNKLRAMLAEIDKVLAKGDMEMSNGRSVSADEVGHLLDFHQYLEERFSRHLSLLKNRVSRS